MKGFLWLIFLFFVQFTGFAQQGPVYGQFFHNPFLYNPAYAGLDKLPTITLTHQRQLIGIEGAPVASTLVFDAAVGKKIGVGARINTHTQGLFHHAGGQVALVYVLQLSHKAHLRFGLAGGISRNQLDLTSATDAQAAYLSHLAVPFNQIEVGFGLVFHQDNFKLGLSFPNMTDKNLVTSPYFDEVLLQPLGHIVVSGNYKFDITPDQLALEPLFIFERIHSISDQQIQIGSLLHLREMLWVGGTYKVNTGLSCLLGIRIKENISFGYSYGMTNTITSGFNNASHEAQLKIRLGKEPQIEQRKHMPRFME